MDRLTNSSRGLLSIETLSGSSYLMDIDMDMDSRIILRRADLSGEDDGTRPAVGYWERKSSAARAISD